MDSKIRKKSCSNPHPEIPDRFTEQESDMIPLEEEEEEDHDPPPHERQFCRAVKVRNRPGEPSFCRNAAGFGTDHPGAGYCKWHSGCVHNHSIAHRKYASQIGRWKDVYEDYLNDPELFSLRPEIAKIKTLIHRFEEDHFEGKTNVGVECYELLLKMLDATTKAVRRADEIRKRNEYTFTIDQVKEFVTEFTLAMRDIVDDPAKWDKIMDAVESAKIRKNQKGRSGKDPVERHKREQRLWEKENNG